MAEGLEPGVTVAGRYVVESLIGAGGIAEVYRVRHTELGSLHALKVLTWKRKELAERFLREGQFQARLGHPNVVTVTDILRFDGHVALVMEFVDGTTLEDHLAERGALPVQEAFALFVPILAAVAAAHDRGVLHRDLKPANVLLAATPVGWVPKVVDFGIAKFVEQEMGGGSTSAGMAMGSPGYMAPEQIRDSSTVDRRADVFALGAILFEMLTGRRAFADPDGGVSLTSTLDREPPPLEVPGVSQEIAAAVRRALARDREQRFPDCRAMARGLGVAAHPLLLDAADRAGPAPSFDGRFASPLAPSTLHDPAPAPPDPAPRPPGPSTSPWVVLSFATVGTAATLAVVLVAGMGMVVLAVIGARWWDRPEFDAPLAPLEPPAAVVPDPAEPDGERIDAAETAPAAVEPDPTEADPGAPAAAPAPPSEPEPAQAPVPDPIPGPAPAPEVEPAPEAPPAPEAAADAEPPAEPEPEPADDDAVAIAAPPPDPAPAPPPAPPEPPPDLAGSWIGKADNRPFELRISGGDGAGAWSAVASFRVGTTTSTVSLSGTFDPASRRLTLRSADGGVQFDGELTASGALRGTYRQGRGKALNWSVTR